jgi:Protein of unknown function (DUF3078)
MPSFLPTQPTNMKKILLLLSGCFFLSLSLLAQDPVIADIQKSANKEINKDTAHKYGWVKGGIFGLNLNQGGSRNWAAGAEKFSFSVGANVGMFAHKKWNKWEWNNTLDLGYAFVNTTSLGVRKTDDKIDFFSKLGREFAPKWSFAGIANFRSQFTDGLDYNYLGKGLRRRTSGLFAPAYVTLAPGLQYQPASFFNIFFTPFATRMVIVTNNPYSYLYPGGIAPGNVIETPLANLYGVDAKRKIDFQLGAYASATFNKEVFKNINYQSRLDLYSNYLKPSVPDAKGEKKAKPLNIDIFWTNALLMKVNKFISVTYNIDIIYDDNVRQFGPNKNSAGTQLRSALGIGIAAKL